MEQRLHITFWEPRPKPTTNADEAYDGAFYSSVNDEAYDGAFYSCVNDEAYNGACQPNNGEIEQPAEDGGRRPHLGGGS